MCVCVRAHVRVALHLQTPSLLRNTHHPAMVQTSFSSFLPNLNILNTDTFKACWVIWVFPWSTDWLSDCRIFSVHRNLIFSRACACPKDFRRICTDFDLREILKGARSPSISPSLMWPGSAVLNLASKSKIMIWLCTNTSCLSVTQNEVSWVWTHCKTVNHDSGFVVKIAKRFTRFGPLLLLVYSHYCPNLNNSSWPIP